jgi:hypothetical protein
MVFRISRPIGTMPLGATTRQAGPPLFWAVQTRRLFRFGKLAFGFWFLTFGFWLLVLALVLAFGFWLFGQPDTSRLFRRAPAACRLPPSINTVSSSISPCNLGDFHRFVSILTMAHVTVPFEGLGFGSVPVK